MTFEEAKRWLLDEARRRGVDLEVVGGVQRELKINAQDGKAGEATVSTRGGLGLRVVSGGRVGYASTEDLSEGSLAGALSEAIEHASLRTPAGVTLPA